MGFSNLWGAERRSNLANPSDWLLKALYGLGGADTYTGRSVTEEESLSSTAVWNAVTILSQTIAALPLILYKRQERGKTRANVKLADLYHLMHLQPNPEMTSMVFRETGMGQLLLYGNWYCEKELIGDGKLKALWPLLSKNMEVQRKDGKLVYVYSLPNSGRTIVFPRERILHIPGFGNNGLIGHSPVVKGREAIGLSLALEEFDTKKLAVISGVGVRDWFYEIGYSLDGYYVSKPLNH